MPNFWPRAGTVPSKLTGAQERPSLGEPSHPWLASTAMNRRTLEAGVMRSRSGASRRGHLPLARLPAEDLVHDLGAGAKHRAQLVAVDDLRGPGRAMADQAGGVLRRGAAIGHQRDEGRPPLPRRPARAPPPS